MVPQTNHNEATMEILLVFLIAIGVALTSQYLQPRFLATSWGAKLQTSKAGSVFATSLVVLTGIVASAFLIGLFTRSNVARSITESV